MPHPNVIWYWRSGTIYHVGNSGAYHHVLPDHYKLSKSVCSLSAHKKQVSCRCACWLTPNSLTRFPSRIPTELIREILKATRSNPMHGYVDTNQWALTHVCGELREADIYISNMRLGLAPLLALQLAHGRSTPLKIFLNHIYWTKKGVVESIVGLLVASAPRWCEATFKILENVLPLLNVVVFLILPWCRQRHRAATYDCSWCCPDISISRESLGRVGINRADRMLRSVGLELCHDHYGIESHQ